MTQLWLWLTGVTLWALFHDLILHLSCFQGERVLRPASLMVTKATASTEHRAIIWGPFLFHPLSRRSHWNQMDLPALSLESRRLPGSRPGRSKHRAWEIQSQCEFPGE